MSLLTQYDADARSVRRMTRRFLLVAILATLALVAAIFVRQGLLRQTVSYSFVADSAQDIAKGQAVRIAGFRVGSVTDVDLRDDGAVAVKHRGRRRPGALRHP
jgi:ABC-type transporter Mla subunit MlaD